MRSEHKIPFFLNFRQIRRGNRWTLGFIVFLMAVAFINLVFVNSLFAGIVRSSNSQIIDTLTGNIQVTPADGKQVISSASSLLRTIDDTAGVRAATTRLTLPASLQYGSVIGNWQVQVVDPQRESQVTTISQSMIQGAFLSQDATGQIILGSQVAGVGQDTNVNSMKGAQVGDKVTIMVGNESRELTVSGIFQTKYLFTDQMAFINQKTLDGLEPGYADAASAILIRLNNPGDETKMLGELRASLPQVSVNGWQDSAGMMQSVISSFTTVNALLTVVGFIIAAVTIFIIIYVDISHKRRQIGVLRAIGIKGRIVRSTYVLQSVVYSVLGVLVGTAIFFGVLVPYFSVHPFRIPLGDVTLAASPVDFAVRAVAVVAVSILAGLIPAILSTRNNILDEITGN